MSTQGPNHEPDDDGADDAVDAPVLLRYERTNRRPTKRGNLRVVVGLDGAVRTQRNTSDPTPGQAWDAPLPERPATVVADAEKRLSAILRTGGFFELDEHQVEETGTDGSVRVLEWRGDGGPKTVTVDRAGSPDFDRIVGELSRLLQVAGM